MTSSSASSIRIGPYHLGARIGEGGAGEVFRADGPDGVVAVKLLGPEVVAGETARARFEREIDALAKVSHPALVRLLDHGVDDELGPYLVTPLLAGRSLREAVRKTCPEGAILLAAPIAAATAALHRAGFVHRDLKPENVMGLPGGEVIVIDLGLAWREGGTRHTSDGTAVGSVGYMAPEQIEGREVGPPTDVFAIGVMLYEWVAGRRPFARPRASEEAAATLVGAFTPLAAIERMCGEELSRLVGECLAADPAKRPSAPDLATRLEALIDWLPPAPADDDESLDLQRAAVLDNPEAFTARVAPLRVRRLERLAREAQAAGRPFAALSLLDRALAYQPGRAELEAMVADIERATAGPATATAAPSTTVIQRAHWLRTILIATGAAALAVAITLVIARPASVPAPVAVAAPDAASWSADAGVAPADPRSGSALAATPRPPGDGPDAGPVDLSSSPLDDLPPIPLDALGNDDPVFELPSAAPGEPIVDPKLLGGRTPDDAVKEVDTALAAQPSNENTIFGRALVYLAAGRDKRGLALFDEALRLHPDYQPGWSSKAYIEVRRGRWAEAEKAFAKALELDAADAQTLRNRGIMRNRIGHVRDAYQDLRQALAVDPNDVEAMYELVQLYVRHDRQDQTRTLLERIVRMRPTQVEAWLDLSKVQTPTEGLASVERAVSLAPDDPRVVQRRCNALVIVHDPRAIDACDASLKMSPEDEQSLADRGAARYFAGDDAGALDDLDHALRLDPDDAEARVNRAMVRTHAGKPGAKDDLQAACRLGRRDACGAL